MPQKPSWALTIPVKNLVGLSSPSRVMLHQTLNKENSCLISVITGKRARPGFHRSNPRCISVITP
jgi:hypothetical protein